MIQNKKYILVIAMALGALAACEKPFDGYELSEVSSDFQPLAKPKPGEGYQVVIEPFPIQANFEREFYVRKMLGNTEEVFLSGFEMKARSGTHHLIAYSFGEGDNLPEPNIMYDQNMPNNTLAFRSNVSTGGPTFQSPSANYKFSLPSGYALRTPANMSYNFNSHYFNKTDKTRFGEVQMNFYTIPKNSVKQILDVEYLDNGDFNLPPNKKTTLTTDFIMDKDTYINTMISHYHKLGEKFDVRIKGGPRDGELVYTSSLYDDPEVVTFQPELKLKKGEGLTSIVTYNNVLNRNIQFGVTSEDEMNIIIVFKHN
ncbi:MAG: hypothetical protein ACRCVT_04405 [Leadbetterella sp.]